MKESKILIMMVASVVAIVILATSISTAVSYKVNEMEKPYKDKLGTKFIINGDTSEIIDYSIINENFVLSNSKVVNANLVNKK